MHPNMNWRVYHKIIQQNWVNGDEMDAKKKNIHSNWAFGELYESIPTSIPFTPTTLSSKLSVENKGS